MVSRSRPDQPERAFWRLLERIDRLETMVYGRSSSVTNGHTRFIGNESILVEGSGKVSGWWIVTGTLRVIGTLQMLGTMVIEGIMSLTGTMNVTGDIKVLPGGKIQVGDMVIDPASGGSVTFPGGAIVRAGSGGGIEMRDGSYGAVVNSSGASVGRIGNSISVTESGFRMDGVPTGNPGSEMEQGTLYMDGLGWIRKASGF